MRPLVFSDTITIRTDRELREAIDSAAAREGVSASTVVRKALAAMVAAGRLPVSTHAAPRTAA